MTFVLGLTGGIATGKSTVSHLFQQYEIPVIDSDVIAREVVEPGTVGLKNIVTHFGKEILQNDGTLDRKKLGKIVFSDEAKRKLLNAILAEELDKAISQKIEDYKELQAPLVVVDVPLMYEAKYDEKMNEVMVVYVPEVVQLERLRARDGLNEKEAMDRIRSQISIEEKKNLADVVIDNSSSTKETELQVVEWLNNKKK